MCNDWRKIAEVRRSRKRVGKSLFLLSRCPKARKNAKFASVNWLATFGLQASSLYQQVPTDFANDAPFADSLRILVKATKKRERLDSTQPLNSCLIDIVILFTKSDLGRKLLICIRL